MADVYRELGQEAKAAALAEKADRLFTRFNEAFWDEASGFYAYCLDGEKKPVLSVASNPGHCLWSGIVPPERAARVVARLMAPDMWSGWGIRTLSADHPSFNPYSYQCGSVWPHDNGIIALGFTRYGFHDEAARVARAISAAGSYFLSNQLPELYSGITLNQMNFPVQYLGANMPQAWAAGSVFMLLQAMLGFLPDAPAGRLWIDPHLPDWLRDITVSRLRVGAHVFTIRFWREEPIRDSRCWRVTTPASNGGRSTEEWTPGAARTRQRYRLRYAASRSACLSTRRKLPPHKAASSARP